jgi:hypothetical protein
MHVQWVDEDEEADKEDFDVSNLQNMSNFDLGGAGATHCMVVISTNNPAVDTLMPQS